MSIKLIKQIIHENAEIFPEILNFTIKMFKEHGLTLKCYIMLMVQFDPFSHEKTVKTQISPIFVVSIL